MDDAVLYGKHTIAGKTYSVLMMVDIAEKKESIQVPMSDLVHNLEQRCWGGRGISISPMEVMNIKIGPFYPKIERTELDYPIIIRRLSNGLYYVHDGMYRLAKAYMQKCTSVETIELTDEEVMGCEIPKKV